MMTQNTSKNAFHFFAKFPVILGTAIALMITLINFQWYLRSSDEFIHTGFLQSEQTSYTAIARELFENGTGFTYAIPYSIEDDSPRIYFHLPFFLIGWAWKISSLPFPLIWEIFRLLFVVLGVCALYALLGVYFTEIKSCCYCITGFIGPVPNSLIGTSGFIFIRQCFNFLTQ